MINLAEYFDTKFGTVPNGLAACPNCESKLPLFAITRDDQHRWRCGHCKQDEARAQAPAWSLSWDDIRGARSVKLAACDWTQTLDVAESTRLLWQPYRQALRDITEQNCEPSQVQWPNPPA